MSSTSCHLYLRSGQLVVKKLCIQKPTSRLRAAIIMMWKRNRPVAPVSRASRLRASIVLCLLGACHALAPLRPSRISTTFAPSRRASQLMASFSADTTTMSDAITTTTSLPPSQRQTPAPTAPTAPLPNIEDLRGRDGIYQLSNPVELKVFLFSFPDQITCVRVHAPWCKTCKSMAPQYQKLAKTLSSKVVFADLNARHNQDFCRNVLDVTAFPTVLIYKAPRDLLSTHPCGPSKVKRVKQALQDHVDEFARTNKALNHGSDIDNAMTSSSEEGLVGRLQGIWKTLF